MLEEVRIRGLGVIDEAVLALDTGLTVVTGETGAGKTMVVQSLGLLFGGRSDAGRVRAGADRAVVEGRLVLAPDHPAVLRVLEAGGELDEDVVLLSRTVGADGRSRGHAGGQAVPAGVLAEIGDSVVAVHGQSDQLRLVRGSRQREALDAFGGPPVAAALASYRDAWAAWQDARSEAAALRAAARDRADQRVVLRHRAEDVERLDPAPGEDEELRAEAERLSHADDLRRAAEHARVLLTGAADAGAGSDDALAAVVSARRSLESVGAHDPALAALVAPLAEAASLVADTAAELATYVDRTDVDPLRLDVVHERLALLTAAARRHGLDLEGCADALLALAQDAAERLLALEGADDRVVALEAAEVAAREAVAVHGAALSTLRRSAGESFASAVRAELAELAMPTAVVSVAVTPRAVTGEGPVVEVAGAPVGAGPDGLDDVELLLEPHPGAPARPLHKGASGGELSRVMLAVEVVLAGADPVPLMVFDEVDAGVGGRAAVEVGRRLARLARERQVLVVTHLPQVAAFADTHLHVRKRDDGVVTRSDVERLTGEERVVELARMLAGHDSGLSRGHAEELLAAAHADRAASR